MNLLFIWNGHFPCCIILILFLYFSSKFCNYLPCLGSFKLIIMSLHAQFVDKQLKPLIFWVVVDVVQTPNLFLSFCEGE